jgi:hypothetical protein
LKDEWCGNPEVFNRPDVLEVGSAPTTYYPFMLTLYELNGRRGTESMSTAGEQIERNRSLQLPNLPILRMQTTKNANDEVQRYHPAPTILVHRLQATITLSV